MKRIIFIILLLITQNVFSQTYPKLDWYRIYNGPINSFDFSHSTKTDNSGIYFAGGTYMQDNNADAFLIKYSYDGDSLLSILYASQPGNRDEFNSLAIDNNSDIYLTGAASIDNNNYYKEMIFQKYDSSGKLIWSRDFNFKARGLKLLLDKNDLPVLAYDNWEGPHYTYLAINAFNSSGDSLWSVPFRDDTSAYGISDLIRDNDNFIYAGILQLQVINGQNIYHSYVACIKDGELKWYTHIEGSTIKKLLLDSENNIVTFTQYDSRIYKINSTTGEIIWEKNVKNSTDYITYLYDIGVDQLNNIIAMGNNSDLKGNIQIKKLSPSGVELWIKEYVSSNGLNDTPVALALDNSNNIYITGSSVDSVNKNFNSYVLKFSDAGDLKWVYHIDSLNYEQLYLYSIILKDNSLYLGGSLSDSNTLSNIFLMKLDQELNLNVNELYSNPYSFKLSQNYPNPFNPSTKINYQIPSFNHVILKVYDVLGKEITQLVNEEKPAGNYEVTLNASNLSSGIYFCRMQAGNYTQTRKMILLR